MRCTVCGMKIPQDSRRFYAEGQRVCRGCHGFYVAEGMKEGFVTRARTQFSKSPVQKATEISTGIFGPRKPPEGGGKNAGSRQYRYPPLRVRQAGTSKQHNVSGV